LLHNALTIAHDADQHCWIRQSMVKVPYYARERRSAPPIYGSRRFPTSETQSTHGHRGGKSQN